MMVSFNRCVLAGNLTREPELKTTQGGISVCSFGIAVNRVHSKNEEVDFVEITAWRQLGDRVAQYLGKGDPVLLEGRLQFSQWENNDGQKRSKVDVVADNIQFLPRGDGSSYQKSDDDVDFAEEDFADLDF